jgi:hypothetical protein
VKYILLAAAILLFYSIVACLGTEDAVRIGNWFYYNLHVVTTITYYTATHLHSLQAVHSNIPILFGASGIHLETADR